MSKNIADIKNDHFEIQRAVKFLSDTILDEKGNQKILGTDKPLLIHSLKVGFTLLNYGYEKKLVIAGLLHDLNEDAGTSFDEIQQRFGKEVVDLVHSVSYDRTIPEGPDRVNDAHRRKLAGGLSAILLSIADHLENLPYVSYIESPETKTKIIREHKLFAKEIRPLVSNEKLYQDYINELEKYN